MIGRFTALFTQVRNESFVVVVTSKKTTTKEDEEEKPIWLPPHREGRIQNGDDEFKIQNGGDHA